MGEDNPREATIEIETLPGTFDDGVFRCDVSRSLAERVRKVCRKSGLSPGELWDVARERFGDELAVENRPDLYEPCDTPREAAEEWVRNVLRHTVEAALDGDPPPDSPLARAAKNQYRIDKEVK